MLFLLARVASIVIVIVYSSFHGHILGLYHDSNKER